MASGISLIDDNPLSKHEIKILNHLYKEVNLSDIRESDEAYRSLDRIENGQFLFKYYLIRDKNELEKYREFIKDNPDSKCDLKLVRFYLNPAESSRKQREHLMKLNQNAKNLKIKEVQAPPEKSPNNIRIIPFSNDIAKYGKDPNYTIKEFIKDLQKDPYDKNIVIMKAPYCIFNDSVSIPNMKYKIFYGVGFETYINDTFFKEFSVEIEVYTRTITTDIIALKDIISKYYISCKSFRFPEEAINLKSLHNIIKNNIDGKNIENIIGYIGINNLREFTRKLNAHDTNYTIKRTKTRLMLDTDKGVLLFIKQ